MRLDYDTIILGGCMKRIIRNLGVALLVIVALFIGDNVMFSNETIDTVSAVTTYTKSTNNYLSSLTSSVVSIQFSMYTYTYNVSVANNVTTIGLKATTADSKAAVSITGDSNFVVGSNKITVKVTSESGSIRYYYVYVTRAAIAKSSNNYLSSLSSEITAISFDKNTINYEVTVSNLIRSLNLTATVEDSKSTFVINGDSEFKVGVNTVTVVVTAENGSTKTYTIVVTREPSSNNYLSSLAIEGVTINPEFNKNTLEYTAIVKDPSITSLNVTYTTEENTATAVVTGNKEIIVGDNVITIVVTAESGDEKTYIITVTKEEPFPIVPVVIGIASGAAIGAIIGGIIGIIKKKKTNITL